jgi:hypothetical protein
MPVATESKDFPSFDGGNMDVDLPTVSDMSMDESGGDSPCSLSTESTIGIGSGGGAPIAVMNIPLENVNKVSIPLQCHDTNTMQTDSTIVDNSNNSNGNGNGNDNHNNAMVACNDESMSSMSSSQQQQDQSQDQSQVQSASPSASPSPSTSQVQACPLDKSALTAPIELKHDHETVIVFDWDDTLLASSFLASQGHRLDTTTQFSDELTEQLRQLEESVTHVLTLALRYGTVHIITNAETGWVQLSAQKFIPGVLPLLERVAVISARSTYEHMFPEAPLKWKFHAFQERLDATFVEQKLAKNVLSFGDSHVEREAVRAVTRPMHRTITKSVKFAERPSMEQLRRQLELVAKTFNYIYQHADDLDLMLTISLVYL